MGEVYPSMPQHLNDHSLPAGFDAKPLSPQEQRLAELDQRLYKLEQRVNNLQYGKTTQAPTVGGDDSSGGSQ